MTFEQRCKRLMADMKEHHRDKDTMLMGAIKSRLDASYSTYEKELNASMEYLSRRKELNLIRKMSRL